MKQITVVVFLYLLNQFYSFNCSFDGIHIYLTYFSVYVCRKLLPAGAAVFVENLMFETNNQILKGKKLTELK